MGKRLYLDADFIALVEDMKKAGEYGDAVLRQYLEGEPITAVDPFPSGATTDGEGIDQDSLEAEGVEKETLWRLSFSQCKFLLNYVLMGGDIKAAARATKITRQNWYLWMKTKNFSMALAQLKFHLRQQVYEAISERVQPAIDQLDHILHDENADRKSQLAAIELVLSTYRRMMEREFIFSRIDELAQENDRLRQRIEELEGETTMPCTRTT